MPKQLIQIRIFVASPGDVQDEREALAEVVEDIERSLGVEKGFALELVRWETHTYPMMGRPQGVVNTQIAEYDVFIGIMWRRFGTPTGEAGSGTEEEFNRAYERWQQTQKPPILFYFCERPAPPPKTSVEMDQLAKVFKFRQRLQGSGLVGTYATVEEFRRKTRQALEQVLRKELAAGPSHMQAKTPAFSSTQSSSSVKPSSPPAQRFSNIPIPKIKRSFTDLDQRTFVREGFALIRDYFKEAGKTLEAQADEFRVVVEEDTARSFICEVFVRGQSKSRCRIWISDDYGASSTIAFAQGKSSSFTGNTMNDWARVTDAGDKLSFSLSGMDFRRSSNELINPAEVAEHFWRRLTDPLTF